MPFDTVLPTAAAKKAERVSSGCDRQVHGLLAQMTGGLSPILSAAAWFDWGSHLLMSPGKQAELACSATESALRTSLRISQPSRSGRFADPAWSEWPYALFRDSHSACEAWWTEATTGVRGVSETHLRQVAANARRMLDMLSPANFLMTNPLVRQATLTSGGRNLLHGARNLTRDAHGVRSATEYAVGENLAVTPGKVVFRNRLIELIQYAPTTETVRPEPILIVPAWIMKYYILDLQPRNSMIRYLVDQGHTVFTISWLNPTAEDQDLGMEDYRTLGVMAAVDAVNGVVPDQKIHAAGYCLGGTMLSIAAAAMARDGDDRFASVTLFAAQTDFTEPGELKLFINDTQLAWLDAMMSRRGCLDGAQMGAAFQLLRAEELLWTPFVQRYLLGETDHPNDLMAWNADQTRMPYHMHSHYLSSLFGRNDLAEGRFRAGGHPIALRDIRVPLFVLGTAKDHVAPWRSVYKINLLARSDVTFVLASGGHNAGVVSEPGHKGRFYQILDLPASGPYVDQDTFLARAGQVTGSWWPAWQQWLAERSGDPVLPRVPAEALCDAPGTYVMAR
ncbi:MAG: polyhydroxyalkanoic acid synthase [Proteobacteria bacterium]|nr:polyhydroxyalkanoic acid synthase [Pseudomonadota bacterium]